MQFNGVGPDRAYMEDAVVGLDRDDLVSLWKTMMRRKHVYRFTAIARVWIVMTCKVDGPKKAVMKAAELGISRETRRQWFAKDLKSWLLGMAANCAKKRNQKIGERCYTDVEISAVDRTWIRGLFQNESRGGQAYRRFAARVREIAASTPGKKHLGDISYVTVWRYCQGIPRTPLPEKKTRNRNPNGIRPPEAISS